MAVITLPTWSVDGWTANTIDDDTGVEWNTFSRDGVDVDSGWFDAPGVRLRHVARETGHGVWRSPNSREARVVVLRGDGEAPTVESAHAAIDRFNALLGDGGQHELTVAEPTMTRTAMVELGDKPRVRWLSPRTWEWQLTLVAADPRRHGLWGSPAGTGLPVDPPGGLDATTVGGLDATTVGGLDAGGVGATGVVSVTNSGTADAYPVIEFVGPLESPELSDITTGEIVRYDGVLESGEHVVINCDSFTAMDYPGQAVLLGGTADRGNLLAIVGDWPRVGPGETRSWVFRAASNNPLGAVAVYLRPAWW